jgi:hypothetical protein
VGDKLRAVPAALQAARLEVARTLEPAARPIRLPRATLKAKGDIEPYLEGVRRTLESEIDGGPIVVS